MRKTTGDHMTKSVKSAIPQTNIG